MKKTITLFAAILCCQIWAMACIYMGPDQTFTIRDRLTNLPIQNATVTLVFENKPVRTKTTDSTGNCYTIVYPLTYSLSIKCDGYIALSQELEVSGSKDMIITVWLSVTKSARVVVKEIERYAVRYLTESTEAHLEENIHNSMASDPLYHTFACNMQHLNRKDVTNQSKDGKIFNEVLLYPNPCASGLPVYVESKFDENKTLIVYDLSGAEILRSDIVYHSKVETAALKPGLYILKVIDFGNDDVVTQKLLIE